jgi:hypothetical protein
VLVGVCSGVRVAVFVTVGLRVLVGVKEAVTVAVGLGVKDGSRQIGAESPGPSGSRVVPCSSYNFT